MSLRRLVARADRWHRQPGSDGECGRGRARARWRACRRDRCGSKRADHRSPSQRCSSCRPTSTPPPRLPTFVLSIVPPEAAKCVAEYLAPEARAAAAHLLVRRPARGIAPRRAAGSENCLAVRAAAPFVDGLDLRAARRGRQTRRTSTSPASAQWMRQRFRSTGVERIAVGPEPGSASAVKMSTASVYKGTSALLARALLAASANGVLGHVLDDPRSCPPSSSRTSRAVWRAPQRSRPLRRRMRDRARAVDGRPDSCSVRRVAQVFAELSASQLARSSPRTSRGRRLAAVLDGLRPGR